MDGVDDWTRTRQELVRWMEDRAPSFAEGYMGAVRLLHMPTFPGRVHFICHVVRDIYRHLPTTVGMKSKPRPVEVFPGMVMKLVDCWNRFPPRSTGSGRNGSDVSISPQVHSYIVKIVKKSEELSKQPRVGTQLAIALFRSLDRREDDFIEPWIIDAFDREYDFFVKRAHLATHVDKVPSDDGLLEHFEAFERAFHSLVGPYFSGKDELDAILQDTNATTD